MTYETACRLICAVNDRDTDAVTDTIGRIPRHELNSVAVMLAAMVPDTSYTPAAVLAARAAYLACTPANTDVPSAFATAADTTAHTFGITLDALYSRARVRRVHEARHTLAWVARHALGMSYPEIAALLDRDHTSVIHGVNRVASTPALQAKAQVIARLTVGDAP